MILSTENDDKQTGNSLRSQTYKMELGIEARALEAPIRNKRIGTTSSQGCQMKMLIKSQTVLKKDQKKAKPIV